MMMKDTHLNITFCFLILLIGLASGYRCTQEMITPNENNEGFIHSPNYPHPYSSSICIMWYHVLFEETNVTIEIQDLDIPSLDGCRSNSSNRLFIGPHNQHQYCGSLTKDNKYEAIISKYFYIVFIISEGFLFKGRGFKLHYKLSTPRSIKPGLNPHVVTSPKTTTNVPSIPGDSKSVQHGDKSCSFFMSEQSGIITVPHNIADKGRNGRTCSWYLHAPIISHRESPGYEVKQYTLQFQSFNFPSECCNLKIHRGPNELAQVVGYYFSGSHPGVLTVPGSQVFIKLEVTGWINSGNFTIWYQREETCRPGYSACLHNESGCFVDRKKCDGFWDCPLRGGDEQGCYAHCPKDKFPCSNNSAYCYHKSDRCNGKGACANYRDEQNCTPEQCSADKGLFLCRNKHCIYEKWKCDRTNDCEDGSDEEDCDRLSSPRLIMACVVGTLLSSLLLVLVLSFVCRIYAMRMRQRRGEPVVRHESPMSRIERDLLRHRAPPPQYNEAMLTSRSYDEAYLELLNQGYVDFPADNTVSQDGTPATTRGSGNGSRTGRNRRNRRRNRHPHRNIQIQQQQHQGQHAPHFLAEQPPCYSEEAPSENQSSNVNCGINDGSHELQPLSLLSSSTEAVPPPYSFHSYHISSSESDDDDDDDYIDEFSERAGEDCHLLGGSDDEGEEDVTCLSTGITLETENLSFIATTSNAVTPQFNMTTELSEVIDKEETQVDGDEDDDGRKDKENDKLNGECSPLPSSVNHDEPSSSGDAHGCDKLESSSDVLTGRMNIAKETIDDDDECILNDGVGLEEPDDFSNSDTACLLAR